MVQGRLQLAVPEGRQGPYWLAPGQGQLVLSGPGRAHGGQCLAAGQRVVVLPDRLRSHGDRVAEGRRVLVLSESPERRGAFGRDADGAAGDRGQKVFPESLDGSRGAQGGADCDG